jgi:hypothetical protein
VSRFFTCFTCQGVPLDLNVLINGYSSTKPLAGVVSEFFTDRGSEVGSFDANSLENLIFFEQVSVGINLAH